MRPMIQFIKDKFGNKKLIGVEIGVQKGEHASNIIKNLQLKHLVLVDVWDSVISKPISTHYKKKSLLKFNNKKVNRAFDIFYPMVLKRFGKRNDITILRETSTEASKRYPNGFFDFIYIDASHRYEEVVKDIRYWYPKIKIGGVFGGHDYKESIGVRKAVNEFARQYKYKLYLDNKTAKGNWWIVKTGRMVEL